MTNTHLPTCNHSNGCGVAVGVPENPANVHLRENNKGNKMFLKTGQQDHLSNSCIDDWNYDLRLAQTNQDQAPTRLGRKDSKPKQSAITCTGLFT